MKSSIILHSALAPVVLVEALRRSVDEEKRTIFSWSGYRGSRPVLGEISERSFRLQRRRCWRNDFAPHLYGTFLPETGGTRIEAHFDVSPWVRIFMRIWLGAAALIGVPIFASSLLDVATGSHHTSGDVRVGLLVPPVLILWGLVLPKIGRSFGRADERYLQEFASQTLAARTEENSSSIV